MIVIMLGTAPSRRQKPGIDSSSQLLLTDSPRAKRRRARGHAAMGTIAEAAYARFLEVPAPVVLVVLWLLGVALLGTPSLR